MPLSAKENTEINQAISSIESLIQEKKWLVAEGMLEALQTKYPQHNPLNYLMGFIKYHKHEYASAVIFLKKCIPESSKKTKSNAHRMLFNIYSSVNDFVSAIKHLEMAITLTPDDTELHWAYLKTMNQKKDYQKSFAHLKKYKEKIKNNKNCLIQAGILYSDYGDYVAAMRYFGEAYRLDSTSPNLLINISYIYKQTGQHEEAIKYLSPALKPEKKYATLYSDIALHYSFLKNMEKTFEYMKIAYQLAPDVIDIVGNYHRLARYGCRWDLVQKLTPVLENMIQTCLSQHTLAPERPWLNITRTQDKQENLLIAKNAIDCYILPRVSQLEKFPPFKKKQHGKIKIGYLSCDFYRHATTRLLGNLFAYHDPAQFEIFVFSYGKDDKTDPCFKQIKNSVSHFFSLTLMNNASIAKTIFEQEIDILIDLKGFTASARTEVFAMQPAPIQIQYLGHPGTMGASFYDYLITDKIVTPLEDEQYYTEKFIYLPYTYQITNDIIEEPKSLFSKADFQLPEGKIILASFNQNFKIEQNCFLAWLTILEKNDNAILWLYESNPYIQEQLRQVAKQHASQLAHKIFFADNLPHQEHLSRLKLVDIIIDTFTCNGHTSTSDALFAGTPVITLKGQHFPSRVSASLLTAIGLPELIVHNQEAYIDLVSYYCQNPKALSKLKKQIQKNKSTMPLFKSKQQARYLDDAYKQAYEAYQRQEEKKHIYVKA